MRLEQRLPRAASVAAGRLDATCDTAEAVSQAEVVLVAVPIPSALADALSLARPGGRVLLFAQNDPRMKIEFPAAAIGVEEKEILGSYSAAVDRQEESARMIFSRRLPVSELISHRFSLQDMNAALQLAAHPVGDSLKVVVHP